MEKSFIPLSGYAEKLREISGDERVEKYRSYIDREMKRLVAHAEDIVQFLKNEYPVAARRVDLRELLKEMESRSWVDCRLAGISFEVVADGELALDADRELLLKCLRKIFDNSKDAMPDGGRFTIAASRSYPSAISIAMTDTGGGIPFDPVDLAFEPFVTSGRKTGAGLGLPIAKRIVEAHGGTIRAENVPGSAGRRPGAAVTILLPAS
jgi:two-component system sensor histidine kinase BaeS